MEKDFFDVFPNLKIKKELEELLDGVVVTRVSCNPAKTHIWVYIKSERWIHKKYIFALEEQIERQLFAGLGVTITIIENNVFGVYHKIFNLGDVAGTRNSFAGYFNSKENC